jgi:hypothetical protein
MPDYSKCIIYTIRTPTGLYVGSTCNFVNRKYHHNRSIHYEKDSRTYNLKLYKNIRENGDEWEMKPYSEFPCQNKMEMNIEEERVRRELNADLNMISCYGQNKELYAENQKQYQKNNKERISEYRELNKEKIAENKKQYHKDNKERLAEKQKQWRENNKEKIAENKKQYQKNNKEKIAERKKQYYEKKKAEQIN